MNTEHRTWIVSMVTVLGLPLLVGMAHGQTGGRAEQPELKAGDTWTYQVTNPRTGEKRPPVTLTVDSVEADMVSVRTASTARRYKRDWALIETKTGESVTFSATPNRSLYSFPLEVGKEWSTSYETRTPRSNFATSWEMKFKVTGVEKVTVPAGTFDAYKISGTGYYSRPTNPYPTRGTHTTTIWYAPEAKRSVKLEWSERANQYYNEESEELVSFKPGP